MAYQQQQQQGYQQQGYQQQSYQQQQGQPQYATTVPSTGQYVPPGAPPQQQQQYAPPPGQNYGGPASQSMSDYKRILQPVQGLVARQRLRVRNMFACTQRNTYDIGEFSPTGLDPNAPWDDDVFRNQIGLMNAREESGLCYKICCKNYRAFKMHIHEGHSPENKEVLTMFRPFKCPVHFCCYMPWPQEITTSDTQTGKALGTVKQDWRLCSALCGRFYWKAYNPQGQVDHVFERDVCCNSNCFAPSICCKISKITIKDPTETRELGSLENIWPGCSCRTLCCMNLIDNFRLTMPQDATPEQKANILGGLFLIDYQVFSNSQNQEA